jgi:hypothetical protein
MAISVFFPFLSLPNKIPLNTSPNAPLPNKLKKYNQIIVTYLADFLQRSIAIEF